MPGEERIVERDEDHIIGGVIRRDEFLGDDKPFGVNVFGSQRRVREHIEQKVRRHVLVCCWDTSEERGVLSGSKGIHIAADTIDCLCDRTGGARFGALEQQMFKKVRRSRAFGGLVTRSNGDPHPNRRASRRGHMFGDDTKTVVERCFLYVIRHWS